MESNKFFFWWLKYRSHFSPPSFLNEACSCTDCKVHLRTGRDPSEAGGNVLPPRMIRFFPLFFGGFKWWSSTNDPQETMTYDKHDIHPLSMCVFWWNFCSRSLGPKCETLGQHIGKSLKVSVELLDQWITAAFFFLTFLSKSGLGRWLGNHLKRLHPNQMIF